MTCRAEDRVMQAETVRYAIRQVGAGWTVYDFRNLEPVRIQGRLQAGLDREAAQQLADSLTLAAARRAASLGGPEMPRAA